MRPTDYDARVRRAVEEILTAVGPVRDLLPESVRDPPPFPHLGGSYSDVLEWMDQVITSLEVDTR